jgi:hypothetical protein
MALATEEASAIINPRGLFSSMAEKQDIEQLHPSQRPADVTWGNCQRRLRHGLLLTLLAFVGTCLFRSAFPALDPLEQVLSQMPLTGMTLLTDVMKLG